MKTEVGKLNNRQSRAWKVVLFDNRDFPAVGLYFKMI